MVTRQAVGKPVESYPYAIRRKVWAAAMVRTRTRQLWHG
jgi:hypothetical protein